MDFARMACLAQIAFFVALRPLVPQLYLQICGHDINSILFVPAQRLQIYPSPFPVMAVQFLFRTSPQIRAPHHAELVEAIYLTSLLSRIIAVFTFVHLRR